MTTADAKRLLAAVGFTKFQIDKLVGSGDTIGDSVIVTLVEVKMGIGAPPE